MRQGDLGHSFLLLATGKAKVLKKLGDGRQVEFAELSSGNQQGEISLLNGALRTATVRSITEVEVSELDHAARKPWVSEKPRLVQWLSERLVQHLRSK